MQIVIAGASLTGTGTSQAKLVGSARKVYDIPSPSALKAWPRSEYLKLHRAVCDLFFIPVPADWGSHSVTQGRK